MSAHELAKLLLEGPDLTVVCEDGLDPSDLNEVEKVEVGPFSYYDEDSERHTRQVIRII